MGSLTGTGWDQVLEKARFGVSSLVIFAAAASVAGIVSFVDRIVLSIVRPIGGNDYENLIVGCLFAGTVLLIAADVVYGPRTAGERSYTSRVVRSSTGMIPND